MMSDKHHTNRNGHLTVLCITAALMLTLTACRAGNKAVSGGDTTASQSVVTSVTQSTETQGQPADSLTEPSPPTGKTTTTTASTVKTTPPTTTTRRQIKSIVIPEGWTLSQIGNRLEANGICTRKAYLNAVNTFDFTPYHQVVACVPADPHRCFRYEGYQFPDTYQFYVGSDAADIVGAMLRGAKKNIVGKFQYPGMTTDQIVTMASIIELEAATGEDRRMISSILHNRLKAKMKLEVDVGTKYIELYVKPLISGDVNRYSAYYNTYKCPALPAGPICSPGKASLDAAVNPADTKYYFFFTDKQGKYYYFETYAEWQAKWKELGMGATTITQG